MTDQTEGVPPELTAELDAAEAACPHPGGGQEPERSDGSGIYDPDDAVHSGAAFLTGVHRGWHAIRRADALWCTEHNAPFTAVCGAMVRPAFKFGAYDRGAVPVSYEPCQVCAWTVAAETGTLEDEAARLGPTMAGYSQLARMLPDPLIAARAARAILAADFGDPGRESGHPATIQLFATVAAHAPVALVAEVCAEGDCEHAEGECPAVAVACEACSLQAGDWAQDWAGQFRPECTVAAPCAVLLAIAAHFGVTPRSTPDIRVERAGELLAAIRRELEPEGRAEPVSVCDGPPCTWPASFRVGSRQHESELSCSRHLAETVLLFVAADGKPVQVDILRGSSA